MNYLYTNQKSVGVIGGLLLLIFLSCCGIGRAAAQPQGAEARITLSMRDAAISDILENITKRYQYAFITRTANVDTNARVSIDVTDEPLRAVLERIFAGQKVDFGVRRQAGAHLQSGRTLPLRLGAGSVDLGVGRRPRAAGSPLAGVTVMVAETYKGSHDRQRRPLHAACRQSVGGAAIPLSGL